MYINYQRIMKKSLLVTWVKLQWKVEQLHWPYEGGGQNTTISQTQASNHLCEEAHSITHHANLTISTFAFTYTFGFGFFLCSFVHCHRLLMQIIYYLWILGFFLVSCFKRNSYKKYFLGLGFRVYSVFCMDKFGYCSTNILIFKNDVRGVVNS